MANTQQADTTNEVECASCGKKYDYADEPSEVKQGGTHICPECWNKPE